MIHSVAPEEYEMKGQYGWAEAIQYRKNDIIDIEEPIALSMIENGDAEKL